MAQAHNVVLGNEKGGSGKSTIAVNLAIALLRQGYRVAAIDLDARQGTLTRYLDNRAAWLETRPDILLPMPAYRAVARSAHPQADMAQADERRRFEQVLSELAAQADFVVIDTPGTDNHLSRLGHSHADTIITPLNDSFVDLDLIATIDAETHEVLRPSVYSEMVWEQKKARLARGDGGIDWIVLRNRLSNLDARNKRDMADTLARLERRLGCRVLAGLGERVAFREMFLTGLTLLDLHETGGNQALTVSHVAARFELRDIMAALRLRAAITRAG